MNPSQNNPSADRPPFASDSLGGDEEKTMPLGIGDLADPGLGLDPLANAGERRKFKGGSLVIFAVVAIACGGLWFMRSLSRVSGAVDADSDAEANIEQFLKSVPPEIAGSEPPNALAASGAGVLAVLGGSYTEHQVPLENVQRNPFIIYGEAAVAVNPDSPDQGGSPKQRAEKQALFTRAAGQFELKSVLMGSQPLANISGKIVRKGEEIVAQPDNLPFRVAEITNDSVTIVGEDPALDLTVPVTIMLKRDR